MDDGQITQEPPRVRFRPGKGGTMPLEWAEFMLASWRDDELAGKKAMRFSDALKAATGHFMMDGQP